MKNKYIIIFKSILFLQSDHINQAGVVSIQLTFNSKSNVSGDGGIYEFMRMP